MAIDGISGYRSMAIMTGAGKPAGSDSASLRDVSEPDGGRRPDSYQQLEDYVKLTPAQRMRVDLLEKLGLTEEDLAAMSPEERKSVEEKLRDLVQQQMQEAQAKAAAPDKVGQWIDTVA